MVVNALAFGFDSHSGLVILFANPFGKANIFPASHFLPHKIFNSHLLTRTERIFSYQGNSFFFFMLIYARILQDRQRDPNVKTLPFLT